VDHDLPDDDPDDAHAAPGRPSKTAQKKAMLELQAIGARLVELTPAKLAAIEIPEPLREAVNEARRITKHEGRRRQLQYIGRLMREIDAAPIRDQLARFDGQSAEATRELHDAERWRERLLEDDRALTEFAAAHPGLDLQALRAAIREARREGTLVVAPGADRPRKHYRALFRMVREALAEPHADGPGADEEDDA
jgi:ribosome-associated protein